MQQHLEPLEHAVELGPAAPGHFCCSLLLLHLASLCAGPGAPHMKTAALATQQQLCQSFTETNKPLPVAPGQSLLLLATPASAAELGIPAVCCCRARCPAYEDRLQQWLASEEFAAKAAETQELRNRVQALAPQLNVSDFGRAVCTVSADDSEPCLLLMLMLCCWSAAGGCSGAWFAGKLL